MSNPMTEKQLPRKIKQPVDGTARKEIQKDSRTDALAMGTDMGRMTKEVKAIIREAIATNDGWSNAMAGLNGLQDKRKMTEYGSFHLVPDQELECIYFGDGLGAAIVDMMPDDMTKEWIEVSAEGTSEEGGEDEDVTARISEEIKVVKGELERLDADVKFNEALKWARLYGGSLIVIGALDGQDLAQPLNVKRISDIDYLRVVDRSDVYLASSIFQMDPTLPGFGSPIVLRVIFYVGTRTIYQDVHVSRCILFKGRKVPAGATLELNAWERFWGLSEIQMCYERLRDWGGMMESLVNLMYELVIGKYKIANLANLLASGQEKQITTRMEIINMTKSIIHAVLLGEGEEYTRDTINLDGVKDVLECGMMNLSAATGYPITKLFGRSPGGMNATGESDSNNYYDKVAADQKTKLKPGIRSLIKVICAWKGIKTPLTVNFNPLRQASDADLAKIDKDKADAGKAKAEMYKTYIEAQVLTPESVYLMEFGELGTEAPGAEDLPEVQEIEGSGIIPAVMGSPADTDMPTNPIPDKKTGRVGL